MPGSRSGARAGSGGLPRGLAELAAEAADRADRLAAVVIDLEEAGAAVRGAEEPARTGGEPAEAAHGSGTSNRGRLQGSREHVVDGSFLPRRGAGSALRGGHVVRDIAKSSGVERLKIRAAIAGASRFGSKNSVDALTCGRIGGSGCPVQHAGRSAMLSTGPPYPHSMAASQPRLHRAAIALAAPPWQIPCGTAPRGGGDPGVGPERADRAPGWARQPGAIDIDGAGGGDL